MKLIDKAIVLLWISSSSLLPAQQSPPAAGSGPAASAESTPGNAASNPAAETYITELKALIATREASVTRLVNQISAQDTAIQAAVKKVLDILTSSRDSEQSRSKVAELKVNTFASLKKAVQIYTEKRNQMAAELGTTKNEYRREDLFNSRGQLDDKIGFMVDAMLSLSLSMQTDEGLERYVQDSSVMVGRRGISVPTTKRNPEYDQAKREAAKTEQVTGELKKALEVSMQRLAQQEKETTARLAASGLPEEEKARLEAELARIHGIKTERMEQQAQLVSGKHATGLHPLDRKEFSHTEALVGSIVSAARRDFSAMISAFQALRTERQALAELKVQLDEASQSLQSSPDKK